MTYSCANWPDSLGGVRGDLEEVPSFGDLEGAQTTKLHHLLHKARLRPGDRVLEFGSGWGSMSIEVNQFLNILLYLTFAFAGCQDGLYS